MNPIIERRKSVTDHDSDCIALARSLLNDILKLPKGHASKSNAVVHILFKVLAERDEKVRALISSLKILESDLVALNCSINRVMGGEILDVRLLEDRKSKEECIAAVRLALNMSVKSTAVVTENIEVIY